MNSCSIKFISYSSHDCCNMFFKIIMNDRLLALPVLVLHIINLKGKQVYKLRHFQNLPQKGPPTINRAFKFSGMEQ